MSLILLKSENPDLSYILQKNPETTPLVVKSLRFGNLFGFYSKSDPQTFVIYFRDGDDEVSYKSHPDEEYEYLNPTRYNSSMFIFNSIKELLGHLENNRYKECSRDVAGYEHTVTVNMVHVGIPKYLEFFAKSIPGIEMTYEQLVGHEYRLTIKTKRTMHDMINYLSLLSVFLILINDNEYLFIEEGLVDRFMKVMNNLDVEYYIRYLFKLRVINEKPSLFKQYKTDLEMSSRQKIVFKPGDTHEQRIQFVNDNLKFMFNIVDVGCGEGRYTIPFSKKVAHVHAIDIDPEVREGLAKTIKRKCVENVTIYDSIDTFINSVDETHPFDVVCSEVIEHLEFDAVEEFMASLFKIGEAQRIVITTPNSDFNKFYALQGFRHADHKFEFNEIDFKNFVIDFVGKYGIAKKYGFEFHGVGDSVNGIHVSQAVIFTKR